MHVIQLKTHSVFAQRTLVALSLNNFLFPAEATTAFWTDGPRSLINIKFQSCKHDERA